MSSLRYIDTVNFSLNELLADLILITESPRMPKRNRTTDIIIITEKYDVSNLFF